MAGTVRTALHSRAPFTLVPKTAVTVAGFGRGGRKLRAIDSVVVTGILIHSSGTPVEVVTANIRGSTSMKFILQNRVKLMAKLASIIVYRTRPPLNPVTSAAVTCRVLL